MVGFELPKVAWFELPKVLIKTEDYKHGVFGCLRRLMVGFELPKVA
jgi:hypothetical protein